MTTVAEIRGVVAHAFHTTEMELLSRRRRHARVRQIAMFLARELTPLSLPAIGREFGRDHTTVLHACDVIGRQMTGDLGFAAEVAALARVITPPLLANSHANPENL